MGSPFYTYIEQRIQKEIDDIQSLLQMTETSQIFQGDKESLLHKLEQTQQRFIRVKAKQKGETLDMSKVFLYTHLGLGDMFWMNGAVRYLSTCYARVVVVCKKKYEKEVRAMYRDDPNIHLFLIEDDYILHPFTIKRNKIKTLFDTVLGCGWFSTKEKPTIYDFPYSFYDDLDIPRYARQDYFYVLPLDEGNSRQIKIQAVCKEYIVLHQQASHSTIDVVNKFDKEKVLLLDLNKNLYPKDHKWYEIAQEVVHQTLVSHIPLFINAKEIHMLESSVYCLVSHLNLSNVQKKVCYNPFQNSAERIGVFQTEYVEKLPPVV